MKLKWGDSLLSVDLKDYEITKLDIFGSEAQIFLFEPLNRRELIISVSKNQLKKLLLSD